MTTEQSRVRTICRSCGHGGCGVYAVVEDGKVVKIQPDKEHPVSKGYTCKKAHGSIELQYHPDRLRYPMRRAGARGEGKWERISWEEALTEVLSS